MLLKMYNTALKKLTRNTVGVEESSYLVQNGLSWSQYAYVVTVKIAKAKCAKFIY